MKSWTAWKRRRADDLRELLVHPEETAGGMMTTAYLGLAPEMTVGRRLAALKEEAVDLDVIDYVYVVDRDDVLDGGGEHPRFPDQPPQKRLSEIQSAGWSRSRLDADKDEAVEFLAKYGFKALPVVDEQNRLKGVISFRSALEVLAPDAG